MTDGPERRTLAWKVPDVELRTAADGAKHLFGYGAVFNRYSQDLGGWVEQVAPGAFTKTIAEADIYGLFNHNVDLVLGRNHSGTMTLTEDVTGLGYDIAVNGEDSDAANCAAKVNRGDVTGSSFSFRALDVEWGLTDQEMPLRILKAVRLYDVGPVTFPAYLSTQEPGAAVALRSLATQIGRPVDELVDAAARRELRSFIPTGQPEAPGQPPTPPFGPDHQRRLEHLRRQHAPYGGGTDPAMSSALRAYVDSLLEVRAGKALSATTTATLQKVLDLIAGADDNVDDALVVLSDLMGVANPDDPEPDAE